MQINLRAIADLLLLRHYILHYCHYPCWSQLYANYSNYMTCISTRITSKIINSFTWVIVARTYIAIWLATILSALWCTSLTNIFTISRHFRPKEVTSWLSVVDSSNSAYSYLSKNPFPPSKLFTSFETIVLTALIDDAFHNSLRICFVFLVVQYILTLNLINAKWSLYEYDQACPDTQRPLWLSKIDYSSTQ